VLLPPPLPPSPGWFPDPWAGDRLRYWDGGRWTGYVTGAANPSAPSGEVTLPLHAGLVGLGVLVGSFVLSIIVTIVLYVLQAPEPVAFLGGAVALYGALVLYCRSVSQRYGTGQLSTDLGFRFRWIDLLFGVGTWFAAAIAEVIVAIACQAIGLPLGSNTDAVTSSSNDAGLVVAIAIVAIGIAPFVEELFFRGLLLRSLRSRLVPWLAVVTQGLLFGFIHLQFGLGLGNMSLVLTLASVGTVFGVADRQAGRLGPSIVAHAILNTIAVIAALAVS
jgi:membrane protease YdiL (CAAX protease family)